MKRAFGEWTLFTYESGANPYIAKTRNHARTIIRRHKRVGHTVTLVRPGEYRVDDTERSFF